MRWSLIKRLDRVAAPLRRLGLSSVTHAGRDVLNWVSAYFLIVEREGLRLRGSMESRGDLYDLGEGRYEPFTTQLFKEIVRPGMTVLDLGSQIGWFALLAAQRVGVSGRVYAFEPDPRNLDILRENVRANGFEGIIEVVSKAVAGKTGTATFHVSRSSRSSSLDFRPRRELEETVTVETVTVDDFLKGARADIIKVDIEGAEPRAIPAMDQTLRSNPGVRLIIEMNSSSLGSAGSNADELLSLLRDRFARVEAIDEVRNRLVPPEQFMSETGSETVHNLLCSDVKLGRVS